MGQDQAYLCSPFPLLACKCGWWLKHTFLLAPPRSNGSTGPFCAQQAACTASNIVQTHLISFALGSKIKPPSSARELQRAQRIAPHMSRTCDGVACPPMADLAHFCRSAASACNLALSLLSNRSPSVRSTVKSVHDGYSACAGLVAASKRMNIYASRCANTLKCKFGSSAKDHES